MAQPQADLLRDFVNGETSGKASNMEIVEGPKEYDGDTVIPEGMTGLVAYGWAVYAIRTASGRVNIHWGWNKWGAEQRGNSPGQSTTEKHMNALEKATGPTAILTERRPQCDDSPPSVNDIFNPKQGGIL